MTAADFRAWHESMGHTYDTGAKALGVSRGTYADWLSGRSRTTGKPITISRTVALACAALAAGLDEWAPGARSPSALPTRPVSGGGGAHQNPGP